VIADDVLAVVVSYNGREKAIEAVDALRGQVGHIHIVDNGSHVESLLILETLERDPNVTVERLSANRGLGYALNRGVQRAKEMGFRWVLTMDQDSVADPALIQAYKAAIQRNPNGICFAPRIGVSNQPQEGGDELVGYAITSGNLVAIGAFDQIGLYDEGFFIDCIDFDFCLRLRRAGYTILRVENATMRHQLGEPLDIPDFAKRYYARHSPTRRYYMYRNFMYMVERYVRDFPIFIVKLALAQILLTVLIGFMDVHPLESYRAVGRGIGDYFARREGPYLGKGE
jgi:rhamnosyltransferase